MLTRHIYREELLPKIQHWETDGIVDREFWRACGRNGLLLPDIPERFGGGGQDFRVNAVKPVTSTAALIAQWQQEFDQARGPFLERLHS